MNADDAIHVVLSDIIPLAFTHERVVKHLGRRKHPGAIGASLWDGGHSACDRQLLPLPWPGELVRRKRHVVARVDAAVVNVVLRSLILWLRPVC